MSDELNREPGTYEFDHVLVRNLEERDLDDIVKLEKKTTGQSRREYYALKVKSALNETGIRISLVAELDDHVVGFLMGQVFYGEFGQPEAIAIIDSLGVDPGYRRKKVARALMHQLKTNLRGLNIEIIQTQVDWAQFELLQFFSGEGFSPAPRLCLQHTL